GIDITDEDKGVLIARGVGEGLLERIGGQGFMEKELKKRPGGVPHPESVFTEPGPSKIVEEDIPFGTTHAFGSAGTEEVVSHGPSKTYVATSKAEQQKEAVKTTAKAGLEFQEENMEQIVDVWVEKQTGTFPTLLQQEREKAGMLAGLRAEITGGKTKDLTVYNDAGDQRQITMPQSIAADPMMRQMWLDSNYEGKWHETKVKEEQLSDLQLAAWRKALKGGELTPTEKQLINWEERPNLGRALQIVSRDPVFGKMGNISEDIRKVNAVAEVLDMMSEKGIDIFQHYPDARYDHKTGEFYTIDELGQKRPIRLKE
ncbi:unnamed protein product, partial [marine sediment metagenome]